MDNLEKLVKQLETKSCKKCEKVFESKPDSNVHDQEMHVDVDNPSTSKCGSLDYKSDNMNERNICVKSKPIFSCEVCDLTFNSESKLKHMCVKSL